MNQSHRIVLPETVDGEDVVGTLITRAQRLLLKHPVAAQAAYRALVAEGRRFAAEDEGRAWRARLESSEQLRQARPLWEAATFNVLQHGEPDVLPGPLIDLVARALARADLDQWTAQLTELVAAMFSTPGSEPVP